MSNQRKPQIITYPAKKKIGVSSAAPNAAVPMSHGRGLQKQSGLTESCSICGLISHRTDECGLITGAEKVSDALCPPKALLTLPPCVEYYHLGGLDGKGDVICKSKVMKGTQFGPLDAPKGTKFIPSCSYVILVIEEDTGKTLFYDTRDRSQCNWLTMVRFSEDEEKMNCVCYQLKNDIYFSVLKDLETGTPLVVGYSKGYRQMINNLRDLIVSKVSLNESSIEKLGDSKDYRDHDYIHLSATSARKDNTVLVKAELDLESRNIADVDILSKNFTDGSLRKSPRKPKPSKKNLDFNSSNEHIIDFSSGFFKSNEGTGSQVPEKSMKRLKKVKVIKVSEKWICKFCYKAVTDVELFTSHLIDHYKSVGWIEGDSSTDNNQANEDSKTIKEPTSPYTCDICLHPKEFDKLEFIIRHLTNHLAGLTRTQGSLEANSSNSETSTETHCIHCRKSFFSGARLQLHVSVNHGKLSRCKRCRRTFSSDEELKFHACRHIKCVADGDVAVLIKCEVCEETFSKSSLFEKHAKSHDPKSFTCPVCFKSLTNDSQKLHGALCLTVRNFVNLNSGEIVCPCLKCGKSFQAVETFQDHVAYHTHPFMCQSCRMRFRTTDDVQQHICNGLICDACQTSFCNLDSYVDHIRSYHQGPFAYCFECVVPFASQEGYDNHGDCEYQHDVWLKPAYAPDPKTETGRFICEMCGAAYNNWSSMKTHRKTHGPKKFVCERCGKSFHRKELLIDHINVHDDAKFKCESCHKMFKSKKSLDVHMRIHNGVKPYSCNICGRAFTQRVNLRAHAVTHLPEDQKGFRCPFEDCDKKFATKEYLKFHMEVHGQGNSIACDVCGKQFFRMHILNRHKRTAHGNHKFKCEYCSPPLYLRQKHNLFRHLQRLHENFKEEWSQEGYANKVFIPGDGDLSHPSVKTRMSKILQPMLPSSSKSEETVLSLQADGTTILNQDEGMTVMISGSVQDAEGEIEIQPEEVIIEQDQGSEIQILGLPETADGQTSMVLLQLDNSGNYVIAFPTHVSESVQLIEELE